VIGKDGHAIKYTEVRIVERRDGMAATERCKWAIDTFPKELKNKFIGVAKIKGLTTPALLEEVVIDFLEKDGTINNGNSKEQESQGDDKQ
jgi:hypothetical protein